MAMAVSMEISIAIETAPGVGIIATNRIRKVGSWSWRAFEITHTPCCARFSHYPITKTERTTANGLGTMTEEGALV